MTRVILTLSTPAFNRTIVELKLNHANAIDIEAVTFNRTIVELKLTSFIAPIILVLLLIVP